eukprot:CAMPEP_0172318428 /NCGR_PEP_ID=MMETSP1058-20130122/34838_1 /TAXON_ID=83371 /ORGANISM="Detonula confervacea, Strain CCMP 353" /LENGTH=606 /DNA_ID=CAMNT_0013033261 /DNA_START=1 /DNA_END=1821 /DNA_ORIENTATION=-
MANNSSTSQANTGIIATAAEAGHHHGITGTYADDDSVVSSEVTDDGSSSSACGDPEVATLTRAVETDIENAHANNNVNNREIQQQQGERKKGILPRNRRECCIVLLAILLILGVALGTGLGLGFFFMSQSNDEKSNVERGGPVPGTPNNGGGNNGGDDNNGGTNNGGNGTIGDGDNETQTFPTYSPSAPPQNAPSDSTPPLSLVQPLPDDLAGSIAYHVISQEISSIASFDDLGGNSDDLSAQQRARDFLVLRDTLPLAVMDEDDEQQQSNGGGDNNGDDDPLAIPSTTNEPKTRPYLETTTPAYRVAQRFAAAVVYYATNGTNWETSNLWLEPGVHECDFVGVSCQELPIPAVTLEEAIQNPNAIPRHDDGTVDSTTERMIVAIDLPENNMGGFIPQELSALPYLQRLGLWSNAIGGSLPSQLGRLTRLSSLLLDDNLLEGNIPEDFGLLKEMAYLSLGLNDGIVGRIPAELGDLSKLEQLNLANMSLRGPIPTAFGQLENLVDLYLQNNRLSRGLPVELENLVNLESLVLSDNEFTGDIPSSWKKLVKLKRLEIQSNKMTFDVDERLCSLRNNAPEGGLLEALVADCQGEEPKVSCTCCTSCLP